MLLLGLLAWWLPVRKPTERGEIFRNINLNKLNLALGACPFVAGNILASEWENLKKKKNWIIYVKW